MKVYGTRAGLNCALVVVDGVHTMPAKGVALTRVFFPVAVVPRALKNLSGYAECQLFRVNFGSLDGCLNRMRLHTCRSLRLAAFATPRDSPPLEIFVHWSADLLRVLPVVVVIVCCSYPRLRRRGSVPGA